jgi:DNA-binding NtrC family response regulator
MDDIELLDHIRKTIPEMPVVMLSAFGTVATAVEAIKPAPMISCKTVLARSTG